MTAPTDDETDDSTAPFPTQEATAAPEPAEEDDETE